MLAAAKPAFAEETTTAPVAEPTIAAEVTPAVDVAPVADVVPAAEEVPVVDAPVAETTTVRPDSSQTDYAFSDGQGGTAKQVRFFAASGQVIYQGPITGTTLGQVLAELGLPTDARLSNIGWVGDGLGGTILVGTLTAADGSPLTAKGESVVAEDKPTLTGLNITKDGVTAKGEGLTAEDKPVYVPATNAVESTKPATAGKAVEVPKPSYSRVEAAKATKSNKAGLLATGEAASILGLLGATSLGLATIIKRCQP